MQEHVGRLPLTYYDANKTGQLVSRIMSDVEGVRNLIGTGLVDFVGGLLTAVLALVILLRISAADDGARADHRARVRLRSEPGVQARSGRFSASAARSTRKSPDA